jgi:hypothetical protein
MSLSRAQLKAIFETGDLLDQAAFESFIDGTFNLNDDVMAGATGPAGPTGATGPQGATGVLTNSPIDYLDLNNQGATAPAYQAGRIYYADGSFNAYNDEAEITLQIGEEGWINVRNISGSLIPDGSVVYIDGASGQRPTIQLASSSTHQTSHVVGIATHNIENNSNGYITIYGLVNGVNTNAFSDGDDIYLGATAGTFTNIKPLAPNHKVNLGVIVVAANNGSILVELRDAVDLNDLTEVLISNPQDKHTLAYNSQTQRWENSKPQDLAYTTVGATGATGYDASTSERIFVDNSVPFTVFGATAPAINTVYEIIDKNGTSGTPATLITFDGNGKTIRGLSTWDLDADWYVLKIVYNGTEYNLI